MAPSNKHDESYGQSDTGNWNVADSFAHAQIMAPIALCSTYGDIALYGHADFLEELNNFGLSTDELRISGLNRLINELIKLGENCKFAMKIKGTKEEIKKMLEQLYKIRDKIFPGTFTKTIDQRDNSVTLKCADSFKKTLELVSKIKSDINIPLNKNHLIFVDKEEFDVRDFKKRIKDRIINRG